MARRLSRRQVAVNVLSMTMVVAILGVFLYFARNNAAHAEVGDCLRGTGSDSLERVACDDAQAAFRVVGRVEDKTQSEAVVNACEAFRDQRVVEIYWWGEEGEPGFALCLSRNS